MIVSVNIFEVYVVSQWMYWLCLQYTLNAHQKFNFSSENKPRCFWYGVCINWLLLKIKTGWLGFLILLEKITSCTCLEGSGLKFIFHWYAQLLVFSRFLAGHYSKR